MDSLLDGNIQYRRRDRQRRGRTLHHPANGGQRDALEQICRLKGIRFGVRTVGILVLRPPEASASEADIDWWMVSTDGGRLRRTGIFDGLRQQGFSVRTNRVPRLSQWTQDSILFSASYDDAVSVWRMPVSSSDASRGRPQRLTSGTALEASPQLTAGGDLIFAGLNLNTSVWALPIDANHARITGELKRVTEGPMEIMPSISRDGKNCLCIELAG